MISLCPIIILLNNGVLANSNECNYDNKETCLDDLDCGWCNSAIDYDNYDDYDYDNNNNISKNSSMCIKLDSCSGIPENCDTNQPPDHLCFFDLIMLLFIVICLLIIVWWLLSEQFKTIIELKDKQIKYYCQLCNGRNVNNKNDKCKKCTVLEKKYYKVSQLLATFTLYTLIIPLIAVFHYNSISFVIVMLIILFFIIMSLNIITCFIRTTPLSIEERNAINHNDYRTFHNDLQ